MYFLKKKKKDIPKKVSFEGRSYVHYNKNQLCEYMNQLEWNDFSVLDDPNIMWSLMLKNVSNAIDIMCPMKLFKVKNIRNLGSLRNFWN